MKKCFWGIVLCALASTDVQSIAAYQMNLKKDDLMTVPSVNIKRYMGKWYEIAKLPNRFQKQCVGNTTAEYSLNAEGNVEVVNSCLKKDGNYDDAKGKAKIVDNQSNAKLKVRFAPAALSFIPQVWGDYWIIDLEQNYNYAVIGNPDRKYLWILSRTTSLSDATYQNILRKIEKMGYNPNEIVKTPQNVETFKGTIINLNQ